MHNRAPTLRKLEILCTTTARPDDREIDLYVLTAPSGAGQLQKTSAGPHNGRSSSKEIDFSGSTMDGIARTIGAQLKAAVVNQTGLPGEYTGKVTGDLRDKDAVIKAVKDQLGLELRPERRKTKVLVIDKAA